MVFTCAPGTLLVTSTRIVQEIFAPKRLRLKSRLLPLLVRLRIPPQVELALAGVAIETPAGKSSLKETFSIGVDVLFVITNCIVVTLPGPMVDGAKLLLNDTGVCPYIRPTCISIKIENIPRVCVNASSLLPAERLFLIIYLGMVI